MPSPLPVPNELVTILSQPSAHGGKAPAEPLPSLDHNDAAEVAEGGIVCAWIRLCILQAWERTGLREGEIPHSSRSSRGNQLND